VDSSELFDIANDNDFKRKCLDVFRHQAEFNSVYREFIDLLGRSPSDICEIEDIPFLPIEFFKTRSILSSKEKVVKTFTSSGTTGSVPSRHMITDLSLYEQSFTRGFEYFYGSPEKYAILALLPSYLERGGSSLVYMADHLIQMSRSEASGFYLNELDELAEELEGLDRSGKTVLLLGVSYALLDLVQLKNFKLGNSIVMETGGMKGRRKEMVRQDLHNRLMTGFGVDHIHSEYGMTELLSQAYSKGSGLFHCPPWMKIMVRDTEDPFHYLGLEKTGGINIIDLANLNSCSFIATQDLGRMHGDGSFEIVGRFDHSDIRGCNLMAV
jgi:phenylacetate-coenzyme A ligase PaaK-like adenylate-forming protein